MVQNYLNNRDLLSEIHKSKLSYSYFIDAKYERYDAIVSDLKQINSKLIKECLLKRVDERIDQKRQEQKNLGKKPNEIILPKISISDIPAKDLVFRLMTFEHIPPNKEVENPKNEAECHVKCGFPPFKHYAIRSFKLSPRGHFLDIILMEVGRSHWKGGLKNGYFNNDEGKLTNKLGEMFLRLVEKYSNRGNWRSYSYLEEMKGEAICQLSKVALQFDESRSDNPNPFAFYTSVVTNAYIKILGQEKRTQGIRDDLFIMSGQTPSFTRQVEDQISQQKEMDQPKTKK